MDPFETACTLLPDELSARLREYRSAEELRLRVGRRPTVLIGCRETPFSPDPLDREAMDRILEIATGASLHAASASLQRGFLSYRGLRIGVCGEAAVSGDHLIGYRCVNSLAVRIPQPCSQACLDTARESLSDGICSTLIVAPPGVGKTSLLRCLIRAASERGCRVSVIDERNELSGGCGGEEACDLGPCSDVLAGLDKHTAAMMLLRSMNPELIAMDEITQSADLEAVKSIAGCGVRLFATAHGRSREDMRRRRLYRELLEQGIFTRLISISINDGKRVYTRECL
ncbi:MAG: stage III sporulation protein AB [Oscillospiraceae bacterium]|nr:stage III sporulation protein AB [Oscillospiraceae bacterium]